MQHEFPSLSQMLAKISEGIPVDGMESLAPALVDRLVPITHYLPAGAGIAVLSPEKVSTRALSLVETNKEFLSAAWNAATAGAEAPIDLSTGDFLTLAKLRRTAGDRPWWTLSAFDTGAALGEGTEADASAIEDAGDYVRLQADSVPSFAGKAEGALDHVAELLGDGWVVAIVAQGHGMVDRASDLLADRSLSGREVEEFPSDPETGVAYLLTGSVEAGFQLPDAKLAVLSESEFFGRSAGYDSRQPKKLASRRRNVVDPLALKAGDYVVHQTHGIGKFLELVQIGRASCR